MMMEINPMKRGTHVANMTSHVLGQLMGTR